MMEGGRPVIFDGGGPPRSRRFGDVYFSRQGGLAESRAVFLAGCGLPERWSGRQRFTVAELGFGTGLNVVALLDLWRRHGPSGAQLAIFSVEAEPLTRDEARRALEAWPELASVAEPLLAAWPGRRPGFHRVELPQLRAMLDLAVMDVEAALGTWQGRADAWLLDGFAPAKNPAMWSPAVLRLVAARSAPGARVATYTVAGEVRRGLAAAGFEVSRRPGFGGKRQRLEARLSGVDPPQPTPRVAIVGAGIAGASLRRAFAALGVATNVFDGRGPNAGASGNPAALVTPRLDAGLATAAQLHVQAFERAVDLYEVLPGAVVSRGVLQLEAEPRDAGRFAKIARGGLFEADSLRLLTSEEASAVLGEPAPPALQLPQALVISPSVPIRTWLGEIERRRIAALKPGGLGWRLLDAAGAEVAEADVVCLATGHFLAQLWPEAPIRPVRGQVSWGRATTAPAAAWGSYVAPLAGGGVTFGATHDRDDAGEDIRPGDNARNLQALARRLPRLAAELAGAPIEARASVRATTPDRLPLAGEVAPGLVVLGGFGARGFTLAPLLAEHLAAEIVGAPSPLPRALSQIVRPSRFAERALRRGGLVAGRDPV